ncbi:hypothetical protein [Marivita sp. S2033]|uniref:hypothetical protein n=1 Tax=Marivita sp. S2033 TaxID=3373187 RepID=UPI003981F142
MTVTRMTLAALVATLATGAQANQDQINQIRSDLASKGFTDIDVEVRGDRIIADADKGRRDFEVVYDRNTGSIISQGWDDDSSDRIERTPAVDAAYADLAARGLRDIDLDVKGDRIFADGEKNGRDYEVVYDRATGAVISEGWEPDSAPRAGTAESRDAAFADLADRGFVDIDIDERGDRFVAEGEKNGRDYEVVYDSASGNVISEGWEAADDSDDTDGDDDRDDDRDSDRDDTSDDDRDDTSDDDRDDDRDDDNGDDDDSDDDNDDDDD